MLNILFFITTVLQKSMAVNSLQLFNRLTVFKFNSSAVQQLNCLTVQQTLTVWLLNNLQLQQ